jgi:hypothetical protein
MCHEPFMFLTLINFIYNSMWLYVSWTIHVLTDTMINFIYNSMWLYVPWTIHVFTDTLINFIYLLFVSL